MTVVKSDEVVARGVCLKYSSSKKKMLGQGEDSVLLSVCRCWVFAEIRFVEICTHRRKKAGKESIEKRNGKRVKGGERRKKERSRKTEKSEGEGKGGEK
ncbi:hypothetical protein Tco_0511953 [Tanacetum coccineum]